MSEFWHRYTLAMLPKNPLLLLCVTALLSGCAVVTVAGAVVGGVITVGSAVVGTTVKVAGKVVEKTIDAVSPDAPPPPPTEPK